MNFDELQRLQSQADFLRRSALSLAETFGPELSAIESAIRERVPVRLAVRLSRPEISAYHGSLHVNRHSCLHVDVPDTPAGAVIENLESTLSHDSASKMWLIWVKENDELGLGPSANVRKEAPALLLRITTLSRRPPRYLWWHNSSDNTKVVNAVIDTLSGIEKPSEFSFQLEPRGLQKRHLPIGIVSWAVAAILPPILYAVLQRAEDKATFQDFSVVYYWFFLWGTIGWKIGRYKGFSIPGRILSIVVCVLIPVWGAVGVAGMSKREPQ